MLETLKHAAAQELDGSGEARVASGHSSLARSIQFLSYCVFQSLQHSFPICSHCMKYATLGLKGLRPLIFPPKSGEAMLETLKHAAAQELDGSGEARVASGHSSLARSIQFLSYCVFQSLQHSFPICSHCMKYATLGLKGFCSRKVQTWNRKPYASNLRLSQIIPLHSFRNMVVITENIQPLGASQSIYCLWAT